MSAAVVDLRSDTVTRPSAAMRRAMAEAAVGDDVYGEDPTVNRLQERAAELFEREAALFLPSGSMGNLVSILAQTRPGEELICDDQAHIYSYEMAAVAAVAGVLPRAVQAAAGVLSWPEIEAAIRPREIYRARTSLIALENTHNFAGGRVHPVASADEICEQAHARGLRVHLDGARIFNAAVFLQHGVARLTRGFDSVQFCLSKGLGAPVGSLVVGSAELIERCRRYRKMLGGGMRQAGILAAAGLLALEEGPHRLHEDHAKAHALAQRLSNIPGIALEPSRVETNIVLFEVAGSGLDAAALCKALHARGVLCGALDARRIRMVTHVDVTPEDVLRAADAVAEILGGYAG